MRSLAAKRAMASTETKRQRARKANFSPEEIDILFQEYSNHRKLLSVCRSDKVTNKDKEKVWKDIRMRVNAVSVADRTVEELKAKISNLKACVRDKFRHSTVTGGGPSAPPLQNGDLLEDLFGKDPVANHGIAGNDSISKIESSDAVPGCSSRPVTMFDYSCSDSDVSSEAKQAGHGTRKQPTVLFAEDLSPVTIDPTPADVSVPVDISQTCDPEFTLDPRIAASSSLSGSTASAATMKEQEMQSPSTIRRNLKRKREENFNEDEVMIKHFEMSSKFNEVSIRKMEEEFEVVQLQKVKLGKQIAKMDKEMKKLDLEIALLELQYEKAMKDNICTNE